MKVVEVVVKLKRDAPEAVRKRFGVNTSPATTPSPEVSPSRRRQRTTAEEANFTCTLCGMYFLTKGNYKQHLETHNPNREKPYKCTECPVSFVRNVDFVRHFSSVSSSLFCVPAL